MPHRLSDPAWIAFQNEVDLNALALPPSGGVVRWNDRLILVYICPGSGFLCQRGEVMLSDVTDRADLLRTIPGTYDTHQETWVYHLPQELLNTFVQDSKTVLEATGQVLETVSETVGTAAGALTAPLLANLMPVLMAAAVALVFLYSPRK